MTVTDSTHLAAENPRLRRPLRVRAHTILTAKRRLHPGCTI